MSRRIKREITPEQLSLVAGIAEENPSAEFFERMAKQVEVRQEHLTFTDLGLLPETLTNVTDDRYDLRNFVTKMPDDSKTTRPFLFLSLSNGNGKHKPIERENLKEHIRKNLRRCKHFLPEGECCLCNGNAKN